jgi:acetyl esterase/lipase
MTVDPFDTVLARFGSRFDPEVLEATIAHWRSRMTPELGQQATPTIDLAYGDHARHRIDVYPVEGRGAPIVLFVHGGGFVSGDKAMAPPFYSNVGRYLASHGIVGACMNYRLAPDGGWPAAAEDVDLAVLWLLERAESYGGDPRRLVVIGQSAGACHVATWLLEPRFAGGARERIAAAVLLSGFYLAKVPLTPGQQAYFGADSDRYAARSPLNMMRRLPHPVLMTTAEHEPAQLHQHGQALAAALAGAGTSVTLSQLPNHNHISPLMSIGSNDDQVGGLLRRFIASATALQKGNPP